MFICNRRTIALIAFLALLVVGWRAASAVADNRPKADDTKKPAITLPKDAKAIVLSYDPGAGGFVRKGAPPYLKIQADGQVTVTNLFDGSKKESKLTAKELEELLRFVIHEQDFFNVTAAKIDDAIKVEAAKGPAIALGGVGTSVISVHANDKKHEVSYRGAAAYLKVYPKIKVLGQYVAVENRLAELGASVAKGK